MLARHLWGCLMVFMGMVRTPWGVLAQKPLAEKLHDPTTDRAYPVVRDPRLNYVVSALELTGDFYRLRFEQAFVSFGVTERGTTEVVIIGWAPQRETPSGELILTPSPDVKKLEAVLPPEGAPEPTRSAESVPERSRVTRVYLRLHPGDPFLNIPAERLRSEPDPTRHDEAEAIRRSRFPLYLNEGPSQAIIPPPGVRVLDAETTSGDRIVVLDGPNVPRSITRLIVRR